MLNPPEGCAACWLCVQEQMKAQKAAEKNNEKTEAGSHE